MTSRSEPRIVCLSSVYDSDYEKKRGEPVLPCLSSAKRRDLFDCLKLATGREILVLSVPPKPLHYKGSRRVLPLSTAFGGHQQLFCGYWDVPKLRVLFGCISYALHALRNTKSGDIVIIDNYLFNAVVAAWLVKIFRKVVFVLDYEDDHHVTTHGAEKVLVAVAELFGRPLIKVAMVAQPALASRLPRRVSSELVPGLIQPAAPRKPRPKSAPVRFVYSGSLNSARGIDVILEALPLLPGSGWTMDVTGIGPFADQIRGLGSRPPWKGQVRYHDTLDDAALRRLYENCDIGLNCQRASDPVSHVTFPSKIFSYLSAGLVVVSSRASDVPAVCGNACRYYDEDKPQSLAVVMTEAIREYDSFTSKLDLGFVIARYSIESTAERLGNLLRSASAPQPGAAVV